MLKFNTKLVSISTAAALTLSMTACMGDAITPTKASIGGGVLYPVVDGKTGPYHVNTDIEKLKINNGRVATKDELHAWNTDIMPDGTGLEEGEGSVEEGEEVYEAKCVMCHGDFGSGGGGYPSLSKGSAEELQKTLTNQRLKPDTDGPVRVFGTYWPEASTLWWYIKDAMPHPSTGTLSVDETYALVAYILNINEMSIDGEEVDDEYVLNREKFLKVKMPNKGNFEPNIDGPDSLKGIREYWTHPENFGAIKVKPAERCMTNCQKPTAKVVYIKNGGINDFHPPMAVSRNLPEVKEEKGFDAKIAYEANCAMCHGTDGMGAPVLGDKDGWDEYTSKGMNNVYANGINGINGMPPKGGSSLSDKDFKTVVDYIVNLSK